VGGGNERLFSLARLTAWCDDRFGKHEVMVDSASRPFDIPWFVTDSTSAAKEFDWAAEFSLEQMLDEIARHAEEHPDWLSISGAL
jgi:CDP-paratose 2-epimerase